MTVRSGLARLAVALGALAASGSARADTAIAIVAPARCPAELRERIAQQIADLADDVAWTCRSALDEQEPFQAAAPGRDGLRFWIDLSRGPEARITLRDGRLDRFVVRRVPLPGGLDEIGREEIGQIVRAALLAVRAGPEDTLTRAEARAEVARWPQPRPAAPPAVQPRSQPPVPLVAIDFDELFGAARAFAPGVPVVTELGLGGVIRRPGPFGARLSASYQLPARYDGSPLGVTMSAFILRAGLFASGHLGGTFDGRLGAGGGVTRMSFAPQSTGTGAGATAAPAGVFWYGTGSLFAGLEARLATHLVIRLTAFLDLVGADIHYDLRQADGTVRRVLAPYRFQPGLALGLGWR